MKKYIFVAFVLILSFWTIKPLFAPGFFPIHDDTQISRIFEMTKALSDGMFPVRWVEDLGYGYGYPIFNFYDPLPYYSGALITFLGADPLVSTKIAFGSGLILAGIFMYLLGKSLWGNFGGIISSVLYMYAPYSALNIYVRGDLAEVWGYAFLPLFFLGLINIYRTLELKYVFVGAMGLAGIVLSHNLTAFMTSLFFVFTSVFFVLFSKNKIKFLVYSSGSFLLGSLLASFYFIPALLEMQFTNVLSQIGGGANFRDHFVCIQQFWESNWGYGGSAPGCFDGMSFRIGKLHLLAAFISFFAFFLKNEKISKKFIAFLGLSFFLSVFFMLSASKFIWEIVPFMEFLQYPWRFLIFASFFTSLLAGGSITLIKFLPEKIFKHGAFKYTALIIILAVFVYGKNFIPQTILLKSLSDYTEETLLNYNISKISDEYMPKDFNKPKTQDAIPKDVFVIKDGKADIELIQKKTQIIKAKMNASVDSVVHANITYFPAWKVFVNGKDTNFNIRNNGFDFNIPRGESDLVLVFSQTPIEKLSVVLSVVGLIILFAGILRDKKSRV